MRRKGGDWQRAPGFKEDELWDGKKAKGGGHKNDAQKGVSHKP